MLLLFQDCHKIHKAQTIYWIGHMLFFHKNQSGIVLNKEPKFRSDDTINCRWIDDNTICDRTKWTALSGCKHIWRTRCCGYDGTNLKKAEVDARRTCPHSAVSYLSKSNEAFWNAVKKTGNLCRVKNAGNLCREQAICQEKKILISYSTGHRRMGKIYRNEDSQTCLGRVLKTRRRACEGNFWRRKHTYCK
jgi:hypothetical protein